MNIWILNVHVYIPMSIRTYFHRNQQECFVIFLLVRS